MALIELIMGISSNRAKDHGIAQVISLFLTLLIIRAINPIKMIRKPTGSVKKKYQREAPAPVSFQIDPP